MKLGWRIKLQNFPEQSTFYDDILLSTSLGEILA